jgi:predicted  nucleic acid-binding Zn-ribbon protein
MSRQYTDAEEIEHLNEQCDIFVREINENAIEISRLHAEIERLTGLLAEWENHAGPYKEADIEQLRAALRGLLDEVMCFVVDPPSAALNHAIEEAGRALEPKP